MLDIQFSTRYTVVVIWSLLHNAACIHLRIEKTRLAYSLPVVRFRDSPEWGQECVFCTKSPHLLVPLAFRRESSNLLIFIILRTLLCSVQISILAYSLCCHPLAHSWPKNRRGRGGYAQNGVRSQSRISSLSLPHLRLSACICGSRSLLLTFIAPDFFASAASEHMTVSLRIFGHVEQACSLFAFEESLISRNTRSCYTEKGG